MGSDTQDLRVGLAYRGAATVIPTNPARKRPWYINLETYKVRNLVERMFGRIKDFRRIATGLQQAGRRLARGGAGPAYLR